MTTAAEIVRDALQELVVQAAESPLEASETQYAIRAMNRYMYMLDAQGISLGYTVITSLGDTVTIPPGAEQGLVMNLALVIAGQFDATPSQDTRLAAREGLDAMRKIAVSVSAADYPCTLPIGSGNEGNSGIWSSKFYPCTADEIAAETTGSILLEDDS